MYKTIDVRGRVLDNEVKKVLDDMDADAFAKIAGELLGGECIYFEDDIYHFTPNESYCDAFGEAEEE